MTSYQPVPEAGGVHWLVPAFHPDQGSSSTVSNDRAYQVAAVVKVCEMVWWARKTMPVAQNPSGAWMRASIPAGVSP